MASSYFTLRRADPPKKWQVRVPTASGRGRTVKFGEAGASDFTKHKDKARRKRYRDRHRRDNIRDPYSPGFWSWYVLWGESSDLDTAFKDAVRRAKKLLPSEVRENPKPVAVVVREHLQEQREYPNSDAGYDAVYELLVLDPEEAEAVLGDLSDDDLVDLSGWASDHAENADERGDADEASNARELAQHAWMLAHGQSRRNPMNEEPCIHVFSRAEMDAHFRAEGFDEVGGLISIGGPVDEEPWFVEEAAENGVEVLRMEFRDVEDPDLACPPDEALVEHLIAYLMDVLPGLDGCLYIHCEKGVSRSTAVALVAFSTAFGRGREPEAAAHLVEIAPQAEPNLLVVEYADGLLRRDGRLLDVAKLVDEGGPRRENPQERGERSVWSSSDKPKTRTLDTYYNDYQTIVAQGLEENGEHFSWDTVISFPIHYGPIPEVVAVAVAEEPDWERYYWPAFEFWRSKGYFADLDEDAYDNEVFDHPDMRKVGGADRYLEAGFDQYVDDLAQAIAEEEDVPPIVLNNGEFFDGRHRILAAKRLGLKKLPYIDLTEAVFR